MGAIVEFLVRGPVPPVWEMEERTYAEILGVDGAKGQDHRENEICYEVRMGLFDGRKTLFLDA